MGWGYQIVGPYFFENVVNGNNFLNYLRTDFTNMIKHLPLANYNFMWLQLDGCPAHFSRIIRAWLDQNYRNKWIGQGGHLQWPPRSPDLTPLNFFLWGVIKDYVYSEEITSLEVLRLRILAAFEKLRSEPEKNARATACISTKSIPEMHWAPGW